IRDDANTIRLAATYQDAVKGHAIDLKPGASGTQHLASGGAGIANRARADVPVDQTTQQVNSAKNAKTVSSGTTAAILSGASVTAGHVSVVAHNKTTLDLLTGGIAFGLTAGVGVGVVVANIDSDVSAFVDA